MEVRKAKSAILEGLQDVFTSRRRTIGNVLDAGLLLLLNDLGNVRVGLASQISGINIALCGLLAELLDGLGSEPRADVVQSVDGRSHDIGCKGGDG